MIKRKTFQLVILVAVILAVFYFFKSDVYRSEEWPVVVVGSGLAGLSAAYQLIEEYDIPVLLLEKNNKLGGNSMKASSGINGVLTKAQRRRDIRDSVDDFYMNSMRSGHRDKLRNKIENPLLMKLAGDSTGVISWLQKDLKLKMDEVVQLGGHEVARTHKSEKGPPPGMEIMGKLIKKLDKIAKKHPKKLKIILEATVKSVVIDENEVESIVYDLKNGASKTQRTRKIIFATGGFGYSKNMLTRYAPDVANYPTTNGYQTTGDGQTLLENLGAGLVDMDQVQVHPTSFIDPEDRENNWKILAAEALRGLGGILVHPFTGKRFANELLQRDELTAKILEHCGDTKNRALLILSQILDHAFANNMKFYKAKGLVKLMTVKDAVSTYGLKQTPVEFAKYLNDYSNNDEDEYLRGMKMNTFGENVTPSTEIYVAEIIPAVHYTMGGVKINTDAQVLTPTGNILSDGLYAAGEVVGGIHGTNRLGGSSLLDCVVYGKAAAKHIYESFLAESQSSEQA